MKKITLLVVFFFVFGSYQLYAQAYKDLIMNPNENTTLQEIQGLAEAYFEGKDKGRGSGYKQYKRWEYHMERRVNPDGKIQNHARRAWDVVKKLNSDNPPVQKSMMAAWTNLGPTTYTNGPSGYNGGVGRVNVIAFHPTDANTIYLGTPAGGIWGSTNGGTTWMPMSDDLASIGISGIAVDHTTPSTIYILTGDGDGGHTQSIGVLKSTNGGATWAPTGLSWGVTNFNRGYKLLMHPSNSSIMFAVTTIGILKTTDGWASWTNEQAGSFRDIEFKPGDPTTIYASTSNTFYKSTDSGDNWTVISTGLPTGENRVALAVTPANPNYVYYLSGPDTGFGSYKGTYRSTDSGNTFSTMSTTPNILGYPTNGSDDQNQASYDLALAANPNDANNIITGGINVWRSTDGGSTLTAISQWNEPTGGFDYVHADIHELVYNPVDGTLYVGSDGGIAKSTNNGIDWTTIWDGLEIMQFYRITGVEANQNLLMGGTQDNGTNVYTGTPNITHIFGADGMDCVFDYNNNNILYFAFQLGGFRKSTNGGNTSFNIKPGGATGSWVTPYGMDATDPTIIYGGFNDVYRSTNGGTSWTNLGSDGRGAFAVGINDGARLYASNGATIQTSANTGGSWTTITAGLPGIGITFIAVDPTDADRVWVTLGGYTAGEKVYESTNAGATWTNISGTLPNIPALSIAYENTGGVPADAIYVGMDVGVYYRSDVTPWTLHNTGLPNVPINDLEINHANNKIRAGTFGRGLWETPLFGPVAVCNITNVAQQGMAMCDPANPNNAIFTVNFDVVDGSGNYNLIDVANPVPPLGQIIGGMPTGPGMSITGTFVGPTTGQTIMVNVVDATTPGCAGTQISVTLPFCPPTPPNDLCANAIPIACGGSVTTDITTATGADNPGTCVTLGGAEPGVWYTVTGTGGNINITTCNPGTNFDTKITVWTGACGALTCVTGNDDQAGPFDPACNVTGSGANRGSTVDFCSTQGTVYRIYLYGFAGAVGTAQMTVTCDPPLAVVCPPADLGTFPCGTPVPPAATTIAQFIALGGQVTGGCAPTITHVDDLTGTQCTGRMLTRTYTISDANNSFDCVQMWKALPPAAPVVVCPADITVACEDDIMLDPNDAMVTTDCGLGFAVYIKNPIGSGVPGCNGTVYEYIYKAVDDCGNVGQCSQFVTIVNTPATISVPAGGNVTCFEDIDISVDDATVNNACAAYNLYLVPPTVNGELGCPGTTYTFVYRLIDECGNVIEQPRVFTNGANAGPTIIAPADLTSDCLASINPNPGNAVVTTSCTLGSTVTVAGPQVLGPTDCNNTIYRYTYTVTDDCGRTASDAQDFKVQNGSPVFQNCPGDNWLVLNCEDYGGEPGTIEVIEAWIASVTASTSCGIPLTVFNNFNPNNINTCINNGYNTVTFRATDNCGRTSFCTGTYVVVDTEAPEIITPAQDHYEMCNYNTQANLTAWVQAHGGAVASDGCSGSNISWQASPANPQINCIGAMGTTSITVQFIVTDNCGNKTNTTATFNALMAPGNDLDGGQDDQYQLDKEIILLQNRPNPFKDETLISFNLPEATYATLTIYDVNGRTLKVIEGNYKEGYNEVSVQSNELSSSGVMIYQLKTSEITVTKTMLMID